MARLRANSAIAVAGIFAFIGLYLLFAWHQPAVRQPQTAVTTDGGDASTSVIFRQSEYETLLADKDASIASLAKKLDSIRRRLNSYQLHASRRISVDSAVDNQSLTLNHSQGSEGQAYLIPSLFNSLPHLQNNVAWLLPLMTAGAMKQSATIVVGLPHVWRPKESYLLIALQSLLGNMTSEERAETVFVLQVSEPWNLTYYQAVCTLVQDHFGEHLASGLIEIIVPPPEFYPDLDSMPQKWGDDKQRTRWRIKQNLDYIFLMTYCAKHGLYYLQLEDDVVAMPGYMTAILSFARTQESWVMLEFSSLGFIGKLFRSITLGSLVEFIGLFYKDKPADLLLFNYFYVRECFASDCSDLTKTVKRFKPHLFQHIGYESSLAGKVQTLQESILNPGENGQPPRADPAVIAHRNPLAKMSTNLKQYQDFSLAGCYVGEHAFWALNPQPDDFIAFTFPGPTSVARYRLLTGDESHPSDKAYGATVQVLPADATAPSRWKGSTAAPPGQYIVIGTFNPTVLINYSLLSLAEGAMPSEIGPITELRIAFHTSSQNWFILKEVYIELNT